MRHTHLLCLAIVLVFGSAAWSEPAWTTFASSDGRFSVSVPVQPVKKETHQESFIGTVTNHIFTARNGHSSFTVDYSDIPHFALRFAGDDTVYQHAKGDLLKQTFGKETTYADVAVAGAPGKRLIYDTPPAPGHPEMVGHAILVLVGNRLYVFDAVLPSVSAAEQADRFLSSIAITK